MRKKVLLFLFVFCLLGSSCLSYNIYNIVDRNDSLFIEKQTGLKVNELDSVTFQMRSVNRHGCVCSFSNHSQYTYLYGESFLLYRFTETEGWIASNVTINEAIYDSIGYRLNPNETVEKEYDWKLIYGNLSVGKYMFITQIIRFNELLELSYEPEYFAVIFTIS